MINLQDNKTEAMHPKLNPTKEKYLQNFVGKDDTAVLLFSDDVRFNSGLLHRLRKSGYSGDIILLDDQASAEDYFTGITSDLLPELSEKPSFLVFMDLESVKLDSCKLLNLHLTFPKSKRDWFSFVVCGDYWKCKRMECALMYYSVIGFEERGTICSDNDVGFRFSKSDKKSKDRPFVGVVWSVIRFFTQW